MLKPLTPKTVAKTPGRGPGKKNVFPFYKSVGNAKKVDRTYDVWEGRVFVDVDADGELIGVEIVG